MEEETTPKKPIGFKDFIRINIVLTGMILIFFVMAMPIAFFAGMEVTILVALYNKGAEFIKYIFDFFV